MTEQLITTCQGGMDIVTAPLLVSPGACIAALNYESDERGYRSFAGYERLDGRPKPSASSYVLLGFDAGSTEVTEGDTVTGLTSGATGIAVINGILSSGSYGGSDAEGELILYNVSGTFQDDEALQVSASTVATANGDPLENGAATDELNATYLASVVSKRRAVITAVPGSGPTRGVFTFKGDIYAVRDNVGATAGIMHKATTSGWVAQSFGHTISFNTGTAEFQAGETLTGGTSAATATIERVITQSGSWGSDAVGYLVLSGVTGTFANPETITSASGSATSDTSQEAITLPAGGKYRVKNHNFFGVSNLRRSYIANGVGRAHEWDGTVLAPIVTGVPTNLDKPKYVGVVGEHLMLGYDGGSIQVSGTGLPLQWRATDGAIELGLGEDLTGFKSATKTTAIITGRNKVAYIAGTSSADFVLQDVSEDSGAVADTLEVVGQPLFLDDRGVRDMRASDTFGNWRIGTTTRQIEPLIRDKREKSITPVGTLRVRSRDIYRLFYSDGSFISIYFGRRDPESMPLKVEFTPTVLFSGEDSAGDEILLAGCEDGFVYQMDVGTSFDGAEIEKFIRFPFIHANSPKRDKRWHTAEIGVDTEAGATALSVAFDFSYGNPDRPSGQEAAFTAYGAGGFWNEADWNTFQWSSAIQDSVVVDLNGIGANVSIVVMSDSDDEAPHTLTDLTLNYTMRRQLRHGI